jgi:hypothetical protein
LKIFTIFKCLIRFLNLLFTILKFLVDMMSVMLRKFSLTEVVMLSNPATRHHQMPGRSWRAGQPCGDGKLGDPDVPP